MSKTVSTYNSLIVKIYEINDNRLKAVTFEDRGQKVLMAAIFGFYTGKAVAQVAVIATTRNSNKACYKILRLLHSTFIIPSHRRLHRARNSYNFFRNILG
jgi:hypothetical protein